MTFQFQYEQIVSLKEKERDHAFLELGLSQKVKEAVLQELKVILAERDDCLSRWKQSNEVTYISVIQQRNDYLLFIEQKISRIEEKLAVIDEEIKRKKEDYLAKQRDEKTWHHLREKSFAEYVEKQKKIEQNLLDEMATIRHYHQRVAEQS
jgi:flagellar protein FliJ